MKKDVIYIDIEDDITAIIGKVKDAKAPIVALVPPKRVGVLQSTVNLKLLQRAAETAEKRIVLITNDPALVGLAAGLSLPIAKNLQSKPEIASIPALETEDDVINGEELPVGELAAAATAATPDTTPAATQPKKEAASKSNTAKGVKVPNFDSFRKRLFLFGGLGVVLVGFFVWAIFFAPSATVAITAQTNVINISKTLQLQPNATLDTSQGVLPVITNQTKKTASVDFAATGKKDVGEKATGTMKLTRTSISSTALNVPAGTSFTSGTVTFVSTEPATLTGTTVGPGGIVQDTATVRVAAAAIGEEFNVSARAYQSNVGGTTAQGSDMTGGTKKTVTVVSSADIATAKEQLKVQDANAIKAELKKLFTTQQIVIEEGFSVTAAEPVSTPALDSEATAAKLTAETTYVLIGVQRADLKAVYDAYLKAQLKGDSSQKVYESGDSATQFSQFVKTDNGFSVRATAVAQVGPNIDSAQLAEQLKDKRIGEVQQTVEAIQGVKAVDVKLSPFWVSRVPGNAERITITFSLENE